MAYIFNGTSYVCVDDFHQAAKNIIPKAALGYLEAGAEEEITLRDNLNSYNKYLINPRLLVDITSIDTSSYILGHKVSMPISIAPTAMHRLAHDQGEAGTARAAYKAGVAMCLSSYSTVSIEDVAESCHFKGVRFFQLYFNKNREITANLLKRAKANGYLAVALTIDTQVVGIRRADEHNKFSLPPIHELANFKWKPLSEDETNENASGSYLNNLINTGIDQSITWKDLAWIKETSQLPLILKGILNPEDAELAKEYGADAIWISNHGGRQIDGCLTPLEALPDIYQAINGSGIEIYVDGGVRKGSDAYKALALGADHVFIGRPAIYGLAVGGEEGVTAVLSILKNEFKRVMQLSGKTSVNKITRSAVIYKKP